MVTLEMLEAGGEGDVIGGLMDGSGRGAAASTVAAAPATDPMGRPGLVVRSLDEFLTHSYPPVEHVVSPWLHKRAIAMVAAWRGTGKTYFSLSLAYAIATGGKYLDFDAPEPRRVLYMDGEMDPAEVQAILGHIHEAAKCDSNGDPTKVATNFHILSHADQEFGIPDLSDPNDERGRKLVEAALGDADVLVMDNLSTLCHTGVENDADSWATMQQWLVSLRRADKTVLIVHHTGKPKGKSGRGEQRGTSKREDILNASILLFKRVDEWGRFSVTFTKSRGFRPPGDFGVQIKHDKAAKLCRLVREKGDLADIIAEKLGQGMTQKAIAQELQLSETKVSRIVNQEIRPSQEQEAQEAVTEAA
jgi:AAA domain